MVVSDTSVLIYLARIERFALLRRLYFTITIPRAVWREVVEEGEGRSGASETEAAHEDGWVDVLPLDQESSMLPLPHEALDEGEAEALALAHEVEAKLVLLDEAAARQKAEQLELQKTGAIGILLRAKREGLIGRLRPELDNLRGTAFWIDEVLYRRVLRSVDELPGEKLRGPLVRQAPPRISRSRVKLSLIDYHG